MKNQPIHSKSTTVLLSIGSNLGDRAFYLKSGIEKLDNHPDINVVNFSQYYMTEPLYVTNQNHFLNCAAIIITDLSPRSLLSEIKKIEIEFGRKRTVRYGPRTLDIDIIYFGKQIINKFDLRIPHKDHYHRKFVLIPLNEIAPEFLCPIVNKTVQELLYDCKDTSTVIPYKKSPELL